MAPKVSDRVQQLVTQAAELAPAELLALAEAIDSLLHRDETVADRPLSLAFFITPPFRSGRQPCADQPDFVVALLDEDGYPVSTFVNSAVNEGPQCVKRIAR
jgi:hypothetical protein